MTRFARALGSKSSNKKVPEVGTPWSVLKSGLSKGDFNRSPNSEAKVRKSDSRTCRDSQGFEQFDKGNVWSVIDKPEKKTCKGVKRKSSFIQEEPVNKKKLNCLKQSDGRQSSKKIGSNNLKDKLIRAGKDNDEIDEPTEVKSKKKSNRKCFKCQKSDHVFKDCPENNGSDDVCFACGSTEHKFRNCKRKNSSRNEFAFATCFICKEQGHISSSCPDNPTGLYPYGGACHDCGDVTHFSRDCPKKHKRPAEKSSTLQTMSTDDVEGLPEDKPNIQIQPARKKVKVVKF